MGGLKGDFVLLIEVVQLTLCKTGASHLAVLSNLSINIVDLKKWKREDKVDSWRLMEYHWRHRKVRQLPVLHFFADVTHWTISQWSVTWKFDLKIFTTGVHFFFGTMLVVIVLQYGQIQNGPCTRKNREIKTDFNCLQRFSILFLSENESLNILKYFSLSILFSSF